MLRRSKKAEQAAQDRNRTWRAMDMGMTLVTEVTWSTVLLAKPSNFFCPAYQFEPSSEL